MSENFCSLSSLCYRVSVNFKMVKVKLLKAKIWECDSVLIRWFKYGKYLKMKGYWNDWTFLLLQEAPANEKIDTICRWLGCVPSNTIPTFVYGSISKTHTSTVGLISVGWFYLANSTIICKCFSTSLSAVKKVIEAFICITSSTV